MTIQFLWRYIGVVLFYSACIWALWRGKAPERWGGAIMSVSALLTTLVQTQHLYREGPVWDYILIDIVALIALAILSLWSRRLWTVFITAFQLNAVLSHFLGRLPISVDTYTLITALGLWGGYGLTFALMAGMWQVERERRTHARPAS